MYSNDKRWLDRYTYFDELEKRKRDLQRWIGDQNNVDLFMKWIADRQITEAKQIRELPSIISNQTAYQLLLDGKNIQDAINVLATDDPTVNSKTFKELNKTLGIIRAFPRNELIDTIGNKAKLQLLHNLYAELGRLISDVERVYSNKQQEGYL